MKVDKTASKKICRSESITNEQTVKPKDQKWKSQIIHAEITTFHKKEQTFNFSVYPDKHIGIILKPNQGIPMQVD